MQYAKGIDPTLRGQIDWAFIWKVAKPGERKKIYDEWVGYFKNFAEFDRAFNQTTGNFQCLVVKSSPNGSTNLNDNVYFYLAKIRPEFTVGDPKYIQFHKELVKEQKRQRSLPQVQQRKKLKVN